MWTLLAQDSRELVTSGSSGKYFEFACPDKRKKLYNCCYSKISIWYSSQNSHRAKWKYNKDERSGSHTPRSLLVKTLQRLAWRYFHRTAKTNNILYKNYHSYQKTVRLTSQTFIEQYDHLKRRRIVIIWTRLVYEQKDFIWNCLLGGQCSINPNYAHRRRWITIYINFWIYL